MKVSSHVLRENKVEEMKGCSSTVARDEGWQCITLLEHKNNFIIKIAINEGHKARDASDIGVAPVLECKLRNSRNHFEISLTGLNQAEEVTGL